MPNNMNNPQTIQAADEKIATLPQKLAYSSPVLRAYGSVAELTLGKAGSGTDGIRKRAGHDN